MRPRTPWMWLYPALMLFWVTMSPLAAEELQGQLQHVIQLRPLRPESKPPVVTAVALHPNGERLATAGDDHVVRIWDLADGTMLRKLSGHTDWVRAAAYSPRGHMLATAGNGRTILLWDTNSGQIIRSLDHPDQAISTLIFNFDGSRLAATGFEKVMHVFDMQRHESIQRLQCPCIDMRAAAFSGDGKLLVAGGRNGKLRVWNMASGEPLYDIQAHRQRIRSVAFSPDSTRFTSTGEDRTIRIWNSADGTNHLTLTNDGAKVLSLVYCTPRLIATGGTDNQIRFWDLDRRAEAGRLAGHTGSVASLAVAGDSLVSGSFDTTVRVWQWRRADIHTERARNQPGGTVR